MDGPLDTEEESFRAQVRGWLEASLPKSGLRGTVNRAHADKSMLEKMKEWHRRLYEAGYLALSWPKEYGGQAMDLVRQAIVNEEMVRAARSWSGRWRYPVTGPNSDHVGQRGSETPIPAEDPKRRGNLMSGVFGAGLRVRPRLAANACRDRRRRICGQWTKVWTSGAHYSDGCSASCTRIPRHPSIAASPTS
jgi:alkylation response protein AidB-like acyl-CoA dehydrogenase